MAFDITLTSGMRSNLVSLQATTLLQQRTQSRLSSGKSVNTAVDDPARYFAAQDHTNHASDLSARKADMGEAIQGVKAANQGITSINTLINQAKGLVQSASSANTITRASLAAQFNTIRTQIDQLASDSGYNGKNFLQGDTLAVLFNESGSSSLTVRGFTGNSVGLGISTAATGKAAITASYANESLGTTFVDGNKVNFAHVGEVSSVVVTQRVDATNDANVAAAAAATINGSTVTLAHAGKVSNLKVYESIDATRAAAITLGSVSAGAVSGGSTTGSVVLGATMSAMPTTFTVTVQGNATPLLSGTDYTASFANNQVTIKMLTAQTGAIDISYSFKKTLTDGADYSSTAGGSGTAGTVTFKKNFTTAAHVGADYTFSGTVAAANYTLQAGSGAGVGALVFTATVTGAVKASYSNASDSLWGTNAAIQTDIDNLNDAITKLRTEASSMAANLNVITTRQDWSQGMINNLQTGSDNLTLADMNEEGANMLALQTRQQLGIQALSLASQANQSVMRLFG
jgi:flagellin